ncbi:hypothetical protein [Dictyobacter formicarum]|uniref:hypothetical protein n=1 Tax=Dictyobacter formicarum TaxID=2778368 RepID=UPI001914E6D9|nr:hypothetical protein [Dictyobacter formicarum]
MTWLDLWGNTFEAISVARQPDCPNCGEHHFTFLEGAGQARPSRVGPRHVQVTK